MSTSESVYVASDVHFGAAPPEHQSAFLDWLTHATEHASSILVNGDLFDFWFEYRTGITRGHDSLLTALREVIDSGTPITLMGGNHDWWGGRYLTDEIGLEFLAAPVTRVLAGHEVHVAHGDGLGAGDLAYRALKHVLRSRLTRFSYGLLPVSVGDRIAREVEAVALLVGQTGQRRERREEVSELDRLLAPPRREAARVADEQRDAHRRLVQAEDVVDVVVLVVVVVEVVVGPMVVVVVSPSVVVVVTEGSVVSASL